MDEQQDYTASTIQQIPSYNNADSLRVRLDTETVLREIEAHLKGMILTEEYDKDSATYKVVARTVAEPLANIVGQQRILMWIRGKVNHAIVQGNFTRQGFNLYIADMMSNLNKSVHVNLQAWGVRETDIEYLVHWTIELVEGFLSRTIDNQERKLFSTSTERTREERGRSGWSIGGKQWQ